MIDHKQVDPAQTALVIVDMQNDYCDANGNLGKQGLDVSMVDEMIAPLAELIAQARDNRVPVIFIKTIHEPSTDSDTWVKRLKIANQTSVCRKDTWGADFYKVKPQADDIIVVKHRYSAFINTRLDSVLRTLNTNTLIMTGVSTNVCVESTARDGFMLDYDVVMLSDCTAAFSKAAHDMTLTNIDQYFGTVCKSEDVIQSWHALQTTS
ncbi:cysteine hydrolase family protein [Radiobacillus sp. PE A8.2]|uniref:cysteine hydrolase family protein n=1 Tax=Radiobacillus sp. PE A8.2 TaxID=3380349 RepID=UPI00388D4594